MTDLKVNHAALGNIVTRMQETVRRMDARLDHLEGELRQTKVEWTGGAAESFTHAKTIWDHEFLDLGQVLTVLGHKVDAAGLAYQAADRRGAALFD